MFIYNIEDIGDYVISVLVWELLVVEIVKGFLLCYYLKI